MLIMKKVICAGLSVLIVIITASCALCDADYDLFSAVMMSNKQKISAALKAGAKPDALRVKGMTTLMRYVMLGSDPEVVRMLVDAGADIDAKDESGALVKDYAVRSRYPAIREIFIDRFTVQDKFFIAVREAKTTQEIHALIDSGADVRARDAFGYSALAHAVFNKNPDVIRMLIDAGLDVNDARGKFSHGETLLMAASIAGSAEGMRALINASADINAVDDKGKSALFCAMDRSGNREEAVSILLDAGINVRLKSKDGDDALQYLIHGVRNNEGHTHEELFTLMKMLVRSGADVDLKVRKRKSFREQMETQRKSLASKKSRTSDEQKGLEWLNELAELMK